MIDEFFGHIARVTSINMLNLAIIDALNVMTPAEVIVMTETIHRSDWQFPGKVPPERLSEFTGYVRAAVAHTVRCMYSAGKSAPEDFSRYALTEGVRIFAGVGQPHGRVLIVAFPGNGGRLMMPLPIILQHLPPRKVDVVMVPDWKKANYRHGISPLADTLEEALLVLKGHLPGGYDRIATFGTSSGGIPDSGGYGTVMQRAADDLSMPHLPHRACHGFWMAGLARAGRERHCPGQHHRHFTRRS